ncbi:MAG TPA: thrombospondin type 3 repeat-containing protein [Vicinamibacterales bacterium]|nr:thrombospondin type 3 repeat-containing protein [Vicinamibacterales bacterium]
MMKTWMLGSVGAAAVVALAAQTGGASVAAAQPMTVKNLTGTLRVQQAIPCGNHLDRSTPVNGGRLVLTPSDGVDVTGGKLFTLAAGSVTFAPFSMSGSCDDVSRTTNFQEVAVQLSRAVTFTASALGGGVFSFDIPKDDLVIFQASTIDGSLDSGYKVPIADVTGTIDLTNAIVTMHVVLGTSVHFEGGCVPILGCIVDETDSGTVTADLSGTIVFPDSDGDGVPDRLDNCPFVANPDQSSVPTPVVTAPPNVTLSSCQSHAIGTASATDVCDGGPVTLTNNAPAVFPVGGSTVVWTAEDQKSRVATASQIVTVVDTTAPTFTFVPPAITKNTCGYVDLGRAIAADDCAGTPKVRNNAPPFFGVGTTTVTWTATDKARNRSTATQTVTVVDTVAPLAACLDTDHDRDRYDDRDHGDDVFVVTAQDACGEPTIRLGTFVLRNGERIRITETGQPGIRLVHDDDDHGRGRDRDHDRDDIKHFLVGRGQGVITATDGSGNVTKASCR